MIAQISKLKKLALKLSKSVIRIVIAIFFVVIIYSYGSFSKIAADNSRSESSLSKSEIEQLIKESLPADREKGAKAVLDAVDLDTTWAVKTILAGIRVEDEYLANSEEIHFRDVYISWYNLRKYVRDLGLLGSNSTGLLQTLADTLPSNRNSWAKIALGYSKDPAVHEELRGIITDSPNVFHKAMAVEAISVYQNESDVEILYQALLEKGNSVRWKRDEGDIIGFGPVAIVALTALEKLGYTVNLRSKDTELIKLRD